MTDAVQQYVDKARELIAEYGWAVQHVPAAPAKQPGGTEQPPFTYTIGLTAGHGHPELLLTGLPDELAGRIANEVGMRVRDGETFSPHGRYSGILSGYDVVMLPIPNAHRRDEFVLARRLFPDLEFDALQVAWPDADGRFPWEEGSTADASGQVLVGAAPPAR